MNKFLAKLDEIEATVHRIYKFLGEVPPCQREPSQSIEPWELEGARLNKMYRTLEPAMISQCTDAPPDDDSMCHHSRTEAGTCWKCGEEE